MLNSRNKYIAIFLFIIAVIVLLLFSLLETDKIAYGPKGDSFVIMAFVGIFILALSIIFWGRSRTELIVNDGKNRIVQQEKAGSSLINFLMFIPSFIVFLFFSFVYALYSWGNQSDASIIENLVGLIMFIGLASGMVGLVSLLLGKRRIALKCFIVMIAPVVLIGI